MDSAETHSLPSKSPDLQETALESSFSPNPPPPTQTLDNYSLTSSAVKTPNDCSDPSWLFDSIAQEDGIEASGEVCHSSPVRTLPWSSQSWEFDEDNAKRFSSKWSLAVDTSKPAENSEPDLQCSENDGKWLFTKSPSPPFWYDEKPSMVGAGLANLGNTCFLNAIIQCFTHTVQFVKDLCSCTHAMPCDGNGGQFCVVCDFRDLIDLSLASTGRVVSPTKFVDNLSYFSSSFRRYQQEDAHEFLQCFLDRLDRCFNNFKTKDVALSSHDENLVKQVFGGRLVSKLRCCNCDHCSDTYEPSIDLSLEIEDVDTLLNALESFTKVEKIEDSEAKFTCEKCKKEVLVEKQLMLEQVPPVSAFHLKRFKNYGSYVEKIDKHVEFPLELDLQPYTCDNQKSDVDLKYDLYAVVVHAAFTSSCGHYYCFIRSAPDQWYKFDDSKVTRVRETYVLSQEAYILFYAKQGTPWFSSFMETYKPSVDPNISNTSPKSVLDNADRIRSSSPDVTNNHCYGGNEISEAADETSPKSLNILRHEKVEANESKNDNHGLCTTLSPGPSNYSGGTSSKVEKVFSPSALKDYNFNHKLDEVQNSANVTPKTPPRSPSPDIYEDEPLELVFAPKPETIKSAEKVSCKRKAILEPENPEAKEACKYCMKLGGKRGQQLMAAMMGPGSEGSLNKRSNRAAPAPTRDSSRSSNRRRHNPSSVSRPLTAASFR